jgi:hypothetical protein
LWKTGSTPDLKRSLSDHHVIRASEDSPVPHYLKRGHFHLIPSDPQVLSPENLYALTAPTPAPQNPVSAGDQAPSAAAGVSLQTQTPESAHSGLAEIKAIHE